MSKKQIDEIIVKRFNKSVMYLRVKYGFTQKEVAEALGITQQAYARYEKFGYNYTVHTLWALATFYNVSLDFFAELYNEPTPLLPIEQYRELYGEVPAEILRAKKEKHPDKV